MSSDRQTRLRLEEVQAQLAALAPELELAESPGFAEQLADLEQRARALRHPTKEAEDRLAYFRGDAGAVERDIATLHLSVQNKQTLNPPKALSTMFGLLAIPGVWIAIFQVAKFKGLAAEAAAALCIGCCFGIGAILRARVSQPPKRK